MQSKKVPWLRSDVISLCGIVLTTAAIIIGIITTNNTFRNSFTEIQKATMIEKSSELPLKLFNFTRNASLAFACSLNACDSSISDAERENYRIKQKDYETAQNELLDEIHPLMLSYGSVNSIKIYTDFFLLLRNQVNEGTVLIENWLPIYEKLPLIVSLAKYDVTGEIINPSLIFELYMPEFSVYIDKFKTETNQNIQEYKIFKSFVWK